MSIPPLLSWLTPGCANNNQRPTMLTVIKGTKLFRPLSTTFPTKNNQLTGMSEEQLKYGGLCNQCHTNHLLPVMPVLPEARRLIQKLETSRSIQPDDPDFSTDILFGKARGQMFGLMLALDVQGGSRILKAFSGQFNGHYRAKGWVPPIFNVDEFQRINTPGEKQIKALSKRILTTSDPAEQRLLKEARRNQSRRLMKQIHNLYILENFRGERQPMSAFFSKDKGMPTGAGDCCAPKLIHYAITHNLSPIGLGEFYFGLENRSGSKQHGQFYAPCTSGCAPILGFMLCGLVK